MTNDELLGFIAEMHKDCSLAAGGDPDYECPNREAHRVLDEVRELRTMFAAAVMALPGRELEIPPSVLVGINADDELRRSLKPNGMIVYRVVRPR